MTSEDLKKYWANFMVVFNKYWSIFSVAFKKYWTIFKDAFKSKWYVKVLTAIASLILLLFLFIKAVDVNFLWMFGESPSTEVLANPNSVEASEIYSDDGVLIGKYFTENRSSVEIEDISDELLITLVHTEDERFFEHHGVDYSGLLGAFKDALLGNARGASTITQQLAKNLFKMRSTYNNGILCKVPGVKTLIIKVKEWNAAKRIEERFTKLEILKMYLNTVYFGSNAYGIKAAAKTYFNTTPKKLNWEQSACIIGLLKATTYYNPVRNPENNERRRRIIINNLVSHKMITQEQCDSILSVPFTLNFKSESNLDGIALYFRDAVSNELQEWCDENNVNLYTDGLKIYTSIDSRMQRYAEQAVSKQMEENQKRFFKNWGKQNPWRDRNKNEMTTFIDETVRKTALYKSLSKRYDGNKDSIYACLNKPHKMKIFSYKYGVKDTVMSSLDSLRHMVKFLHCGFVAIEPQTGLVKAWVGDVDYNYWQYDKVLAKRQPGSTFKLFVYSEAIRKGMSPCDIRTDSITSWMTEEDGKPVLWQPQNANGIFSGEKLTLKTAMARSINSIAVQLNKELGPENVVELAHKMGVESPVRPIPSVCLGTEDVSLLEMVSAYSTIPNEGVHMKPRIVTRIEDKDGNVIYKNEPKGEKVLSYEEAFLVREMLREGLADERGTSRRLWNYKIHGATDFGGKTGSTSNYSDAWYMGISPKLVAGAWVGGEYRCIHFKDGEQGQGSASALPIFGAFMEKVMNDKKLARYRGRFGEPKQTISRTYDCTEVLEELEEEEQKNEGARGFFRRLFGRDKQENVRPDSIKIDVKSRRELRQERREMRREERKRRRNRD
ncbi:MAG: penicillin-binding protein [Bacteroidales bacterium]|jgi:penicillin-binding protein 1A|nr:penicillin-binding protein [Bacteroidales bacterium]